MFAGRISRSKNVAVALGSSHERNKLSAARLEVEIEPGIVLEFQATSLPVTLSTDDHERGHETRDNKIAGELAGVPNLTMLGFERFSASKFGIDFSEPQSSG